MRRYEVLIGKTMASVVNNDNRELVFTPTEGPAYKFYHFQECCESVYISEIVGDLEDLVGIPLTMAEFVDSGYKSNPEWGDQESWTFYKFATRKGYVTVRWYGSSNGYYSTSVNFGEANCKTGWDD